MKFQHIDRYHKHSLCRMKCRRTGKRLKRAIEKQWRQHGQREICKQLEEKRGNDQVHPM